MINPFRSKAQQTRQDAQTADPQAVATGEINASLLSRPGFAAAVMVWARRDQQQRINTLSRVVIAQAIGNVAALVVICILAISGPYYRYFATEPNGALIRLVPLSRSIMSSADLGQWIETHVTDAFTLSWTNYRGDQMRAKHAFTRAGWLSYLKGIRQARIIKLIEAEQLNLTSVVTQAPVLTRTGRLGNGALWWQYQFTMVWTYNAGNNSPVGTSNQNVVVDVRVVRVPQTLNPKGVLISEIVARRNS